MNKKRIGIVAGLLLGSLGAVGVASAGMSDNTVVTFFAESNGQLSAKGTLRAVRNSADNKQYIGCSIYSYDNNSLSAVCYAHDAGNGYRSCSTIDPHMVAIAQSLNPASYLYFSVNADGSCDRVISVNYSADL